MAKHDHCNICDYTEASGSPSAGINPGRNGKVRRHGDDLLCDTCVGAVGQNYTDLVMGEDEQVG